MSNVNIETANQVAGWTGLGIKLSKDLAAAVEIFDKIQWIEVGHAFQLNIAEVTADNAEAKIRELAEHMLIAEAQPGSLSTLAEAKRWLSANLDYGPD